MYCSIVHIYTYIYPLLINYIDLLCLVDDESNETCGWYIFKSVTPIRTEEIMEPCPKPNPWWKRGSQAGRHPSRPRPGPRQPWPSQPRPRPSRKLTHMKSVCVSGPPQKDECIRAMRPTLLEIKKYFRKEIVTHRRIKLGERVAIRKKTVCGYKTDFYKIKYLNVCYKKPLMKG